MFYFEKKKKKQENFYFKTDISIFLGYSSIRKAYRIFNKRTLVIEELMHVVFYEFCNNICNESIWRDDLERKFGDFK